MNKCEGLDHKIEGFLSGPDVKVSCTGEFLVCPHVFVSLIYFFSPM
jgi:hypothetical protein